MNKESKFSPYNCRDSKTYQIGLFPDDPTGEKFLNPLFYKIRDTVRGDIEPWFRYSPSKKNEGDGNTDLTSYSRDYVQKEFGGQRSFFSREAVVLDLGCGFGVAATEFSKTKRAHIFGMDKRFAKDSPLYPKSVKFVAGDWEKLPFKNDYFTGILAFETFPRYGGYNTERDKNTFREITRICRSGAVWRGTVGFPGFELGNEERDMNFQPIYSKQTIIENLNENGWDVYYGRNIFIAQLNHKQDRSE